MLQTRCRELDTLLGEMLGNKLKNKPVSNRENELAFCLISRKLFFISPQTFPVFLHFLTAGYDYGKTCHGWFVPSQFVHEYGQQVHIGSVQLELLSLIVHFFFFIMVFMDVGHISAMLNKFC